MSRVRPEGRIFLFKTGHQVPTVTIITIPLTIAIAVVTAIATDIAVSLTVDIAPTVTLNTTIATDAIELHNSRTSLFRCPREYARPKHW